MTTVQQTGAYSVSGLNYFPFENPSAIAPKLGVGTYSINFGQQDNQFFLTKCEDFTLPSKVYGSNTNYTETILNTFLNTRKDKITSAVLSGIRGSGKTLTAKQISIEAVKLGIPTLILNAPYTGNSFIEFLTHIKTPFVLFIDEFEKVFHDKNDLNKLLSMLDGTMSAHMLCVMTMNSSLNDPRFEFFKNRPGRVYYNIHYPPCADDVIREYLAENLQDQTQFEKVLNFTYRFQMFTIDLLSVLVTEINLHPNTPLMDLCHVLNIKPDAELNSEYYNFTLIQNNGKTYDGIYTLADSIYKCNYVFIKDLLTYAQAELKVYIRPDHHKYETLADATMSDQFSYYYNTLDEVSETLIKSIPQLKALYDSTPSDEHSDTVAEYCTTFYLRLQDIQDGKNPHWSFNVDYQTRTLTLTNTLLDFKIEIKGKRKEERPQIFLL